MKAKIEEIMRRLGVLQKATPGMTTGFYSMIKSAEDDKVLDAKTRELIALAVAITTRCDDCLTLHVEEARKAGATREEIASALSVAVNLNTGAAYCYSARVLDAFDKL